MKKEILERIKNIEILIQEMKEYKFSDSRINNLTVQYKALLKYIDEAEKTDDIIKVILDASEELNGEALYLFDEFTTPHDDVSNRMRKNVTYFSIINKLKEIESGIKRILNTLHYLDFHMNELNIMLDKLEYDFSINGSNDANILSILDIVNKLDVLFSIYDGIYHEILNLDEYSFELGTIKDVKFIKLVQRIIKMENQLKGFSIVFNNLNKDSSLDINTFNTLSNNESMKLRKTANN